MARRQLSWKPVRKGTIYCAPACGRGCTYVEYQQAKANAENLKRRLNGKGWKIEVYENLGWHFKVRNDYLNVYGKEFADKYSCLMADTKEGAGGLSLWHVNNYAKDPNVSVRKQIEHAEAVVSILVQAVNGARKSAGI
jgi:hypothetical protein